MGYFDFFDSLVKKELMDQVNKHHFRKIIRKYRQGKATKEEIKFLEAYYDVFELNEDLISEENEKDYLQLRDAIKNNVDQRIDQHTSINPTTRLWIRYVAAASILIVLSVGIVSVFRKNKDADDIAAKKADDIPPGGNKATLTLANGTRILLDDAASGELARQAGVIITKTADGQLVYKAINDAADGEVLQNSISTPRGGQYKVVLPDGTNVWLNAASSITYPTAFKGTERLVTLTGEAYFEVAKNKEMPFKVKSELQMVKVLGTHFNINAYTDEAAVKTTLLEGAVEVASSKASITLSPGQQGLVEKDQNGAIIKRDVDTEQEVAWKNGVFSFKGEDLPSVMRQVARWYDIEVVFEGDVSEKKFYGEIARSSSLKNVFKILELYNVKFTLSGKTVSVSYKKP